MFAPSPRSTPIVFVILKRSCAVLLTALLVIGFISAYRAWYQVKSLNLNINGFATVIRPNDPRTQTTVRINPGTVVEARVVSYARGPIDVKLELIQGDHSESIFTRRLPGNEWAFFDPRTRQAAFSAPLTEDVLNRFQAGMATLRATATGREQWTRLPPPLVTNAAVIVQKKESN